MNKNIVVLLLGLALGSGAVYFGGKVFKDKPPRLAQREIKAQSKNQKPTLKFINPLVYSSEFNNLYFDEMLGFRADVLAYLKSQENQNEGYEFGFYFLDLTTGASIGYNEKIKFTPASLMKVPILVALYKEAERVPKLLDKEVVYRKGLSKMKAYEEEFQFEIGKGYSLGELGQILVEYSDNRAAVLILNGIGFDRVEQVQSDLGFGIENETDGAKRIIGVKTYASIFRILYNAHYLSKASSDAVLQLLMTPRYQEGVRKAVPSDVAVAHKFGIRILTDENGEDIGIDQLHHFGIVYRPGKPYLIGIMMKGDDRGKMEDITFNIIQRIDGEIASNISEIQKSGIPAELR